jgi:flavin-dependent dehydrogenase
MRRKQPAHRSLGRHRAVVIGGGMAGLLATRVLSDHFAQVALIERDRLTGDAEPRRGVPQGRHVHSLLARGAIIMGEYFPDLFRALARDGVVPVGTERIHWNQLGVWMAPVRSPVKVSFQSRPFLEQHVREQLAARENVRIMDACEVSQLCAHNDRVTGVVLRHRAGEQHEEELTADLVVDVSGRGSRASHWLNSLGYGNVQETSIKIDVGYATRIYRSPAQLSSAWKVLLIFGNPPDDKRGGVIFPIQGGYWMVTLAGSLHDYPPNDETAFLEFARSLAQPDLYEAIKDAEPVKPITVYKFPQKGKLRQTSCPFLSLFVLEIPQTLQRRCRLPRPGRTARQIYRSKIRKAHLWIKRLKD